MSEPTIPRTGQKRATALDAEIAARISRKRKEVGLSQSDLAQTLNVSFQQIQKYEKGSSRISAGRLVLIADAFRMDVADLLKGLSQSGS